MCMFLKKKKINILEFKPLGLIAEQDGEMYHLQAAGTLSVFILQ